MIHRYVFFACLAALSLHTYSPASAQDSHVQDRIQKPAPLVVLTGGFDSCVSDGDGGISPFGGNFNSEGVKFVNELTDYFSAPDVNWRGMSDRGIRWIFSCFNKTSDLFVQSSLDSGPVQGAPYDLDFVLSRIEELSDNYRRPIFVVGHSHGGWLAMQIVEALRQPVSDGFLATIDPISFVECNPATYADAILLTGPEGPWVGWDRLAPCRQAPGDFSGRDVERIRSRLPAESWKHYYQTHFFPLHSGEIANGPSFSSDLTPYFSLLWGGVASSWNAHIRIANLSTIWYGLKMTLLHRYGEG